MVHTICIGQEPLNIATIKTDGTWGLEESLQRRMMEWPQFTHFLLSITKYLNSALLFLGL